MNVLTRIGVLFTVLGFGSLILEQMHYEFRIIAWAYDMQPTFGLVLGVIGLAMIGGAVLLGRRRAVRPVPVPPAAQGWQPPAPSQGQ